MALNSITLTSDLSAADKTQINDLLNQLIIWHKNNMDLAGTPYTVMYDNLAETSGTVGRCFVWKTGDNDHYIQLNVYNNTQIGFCIIKLNVITFPASIGVWAIKYYTLKNLVCRSMIGAKCVLLRLGADGISTVDCYWSSFWQDGFWQTGRNDNIVGRNDDSVAYIITSPTYGIVIDSDGNSPLIPAMFSYSGIIQPAQPYNMFGTTLASGYFFFTDSLGDRYFLAGTLLHKEI